MKINSDFNQRVVVHSATQEWLESPMKGVFRRPLDRVGAEVARATSIVKYMPNSVFSPHIHTGGEEFFILDGVFQDQHGDYPAGSYVRNPPQTSHTPSSMPGCVMFVKLWQFRPEDTKHVHIDTNSVQSVPHENIQNASHIPLFHDRFEDVSIQFWAANSTVQIDADEGLEVLVLDGDFIEGQDTLNVHSWLRMPMGCSMSAQVGPRGAKVWLKCNHLRNVDEQIARLSTA